MLFEQDVRRRPEKPATAPANRGVDVRRKQFARIKEADPKVFKAQVDACGTDIKALLGLMQRNADGVRQQLAKHQRANGGGWPRGASTSSTQSNSPLTVNTGTTWTQGTRGGDEDDAPASPSVPPPADNVSNVDASSQTYEHDHQPDDASLSPTSCVSSASPVEDGPLESNPAVLQARLRERERALRLSERKLEECVLKCSHMEAQMARMCESHTAELRRVKAEEAPRLKGEVCVMSARFHALSQQISEALTAKAQTEEKLKRIESQKALMPAPGRMIEDVTHEKLREKVRMMETENKAVVEQLGKYKHRSIELSRYEVHSVALSKDLCSATEELKAKSKEAAERTSEVATLTAQLKDAKAALLASQAAGAAQSEALQGCTTEIEELKKSVELLRGAKPDNRIIEGLQDIENLRDMLKAQTDELLELKTSNAELIRLRERAKDLAGDLEKVRQEVAQRDGAIALMKDKVKEAARVPAYKQKIETLKFTAEKATWDKKVALKQAAEDTKKYEKKVAGLEVEILKLKGEYVEPEATFTDAFGSGDAEGGFEEEEEGEEEVEADDDLG